MKEEQKLLSFLYMLQERSVYKKNKKLSKALNNFITELEFEIQTSQSIPLI
jgi:hypothetical protein